MTRYPPWDPKAGLIMCIGCPYCRDDDPDVACDCPCHDVCDECGASLDDAGYGGLCGNCADEAHENVDPSC